MGPGTECGWCGLASFSHNPGSGGQPQYQHKREDCSDLRLVWVALPNTPNIGSTDTLRGVDLSFLPSLQHPSYGHSSSFFSHLFQSSQSQLSSRLLLPPIDISLPPFGPAAGPCLGRGGVGVSGSTLTRGFYVQGARVTNEQGTAPASSISAATTRYYHCIYHCH